MRRRTRMMMIAKMGGDPEQRYDGNYEPESRFRDRRGREHYDNGRFAPRNEGDREPYGYVDNRRYAEHRGGGVYNRYEPMGHHGGHEQSYKLMGKIGFARQHESDGLSWELAQEWVNGMKNSDGTRGPKWHIDQVEQLMKKKHIDCDPIEFWAVMNSLYSDFGKVMKEFGFATADMFAALAQAWLEDEDAVDDKAAAYFEHIVK